MISLQTCQILSVCQGVFIIYVICVTCLFFTGFSFCNINLYLYAYNVNDYNVNGFGKRSVCTLFLNFSV